MWNLSTRVIVDFFTEVFPVPIISRTQSCAGMAGYIIHSPFTHLLTVYSSGYISQDKIHEINTMWVGYIILQV